MKSTNKLLAGILSASMLFSMVVANADTQTEVILQIDNPIMTVNGTEKEIDPGIGTSPVIIDDRTLLPIRAVIEEIGGAVDWNGDTREVTLTYNDNTIRLVIDSTTAYLNNVANTLDIAPTIIKDRTMLPIRFIAESFDFDVDWDGTTQTVTITKADDAEPSQTPSATSTPTATTVPTTDEQSAATLSVQFGNDGASYTMVLEDNPVVQYLAEFADAAGINLPIYHDDDYEGYEYYDIPKHYNIPAELTKVTSQKAGEVYYADHRILLFYEDANLEGEYMKIGTIENTAGLKEAVEENPVLEGWGNKIISIKSR